MYLAGSRWTSTAADRSAPAVAENDDGAQAVLQMVDSIAETAHDIVTQTVAGSPDDEEVIRPF
jgi:hypothetical protein